MPHFASRPRLRRVLRLSLGGMMVLILILAGWLGWLTNRARTQRKAVEAIVARGGQVLYAHEYVANKFVPNTAPPGPKWLRSRIGVDYFQTPYRAFLMRPEYMPANAKATRKPIPPAKPHDDDIMAAFASLPELESISLDRGPATDEGLSSLRGLKNLHSLTIGEADDMTDAGLAHLAGLSNLEKLIIGSARRITDAGVAHLANLKSLTELWLPDQNLTDASLTTIGGLRKLETLYLQSDLGDNLVPRYEAFSHGTIGDAGLVQLSSIPSLKRLQVQAPKAGDSGLASLVNLRQLESLAITTGPISARGLAPLREIPKLDRLDIFCLAIDEGGLDSLRTYTVLRSLYLSCPNLTSRHLEAVARASGVTYLTLDCRNLTDDSLKPLAAMKKLGVLQIHNGEKLTDQALENIRGLDSLGSLAIMKWGFQGIVPGCQIGDRGLLVAASMRKIRMVRMSSPAITKAGIDQVAKARPGVRLITPAGSTPIASRGAAAKRATPASR